MNSNEIAKKQLVWTQILTVAVLALLLLVLIMTISFLRTAQSLRELGTELKTLTTSLNDLTSAMEPEELKESLEALKRVADKMGELDWSTLGDNANEVMEKAKVTLDHLSDAIDRMDFDALNKAISDLQALIEPLSKVARLFG